MPIKYDKHGRLKRPGKKIEFDAAMLANYAHCVQDVKFFAENFYYVVHQITGAQLIVLRDYQEEILESFQSNRLNILMAARQCGKTTCSAIYLLWFAMFQKDKTVAILANKASTAVAILDEIKFAYERLPEYLKPGVIEYNKGTVEFDNGCKILARATSKDALRGESAALIFLDEFAFLPGNLADEFWASNLPVISTGGKCIVVSTPNGTGNLFYNLWKDATDESKAGEFPFVPLSVNWQRVPGRDEKWEKEMRQMLGNIRFSQEFDCKFQGSSITLIEAEFIIKKLNKKEPLWMPDEWTKMWSQVKPGHKYAISCDVGGGVGSDFSIINVFDITGIPQGMAAEQVAIWRCNTLPPTRLAEYVYNSAKYWNDAYVIIEVNPGGYGDDVCAELFNDYEYENLFFDVNRGEYGVLATRATKPKACQDFKQDLESGKIILNCDQTIDEIGYFEEIRPGVFKGKEGKNLYDDCVMSCIWFSYFLHSDFFEGEKYEWQEKNILENDPELWYRMNRTHPDETPLNDANYDPEAEEAFEGFLQADSEMNDPDNWLMDSEVKDFKQEIDRHGGYDKYLQHRHGGGSIPR